VRAVLTRPREKPALLARTARWPRKSHNIHTAESVSTRSLRSNVDPSRSGLVFVCPYSNLSIARSKNTDVPAPQMSSLDFSLKLTEPNPAPAKSASYHQWASQARANSEKPSVIGRIPIPVAVAM
jgi:hypothetical protein